MQKRARIYTHKRECEEVNVLSRGLHYFTFCIILLFGTISVANAATVSEPRLRYQSIELDIVGPLTNENAASPNPFLDIRFDLTLEAPSGKSVTVPGFFAGNGQGGGQGNIWRARFTPDEAGVWKYTASLFTGTHAAVQTQTNALQDITRQEDRQGTFNVSVSDQLNAALQRGPLRYVGDHYLRFDDGSYWLKGGVDSPENFFGYAGFDNTFNQPGGIGEAQLPGGLHHFADHVVDWNPGDPLFVSADSGVDSKGIIGAVNYLASQGINSMYFLLMNLGGDGRDTYPFIQPSGNVHDNTHYDISKLRQWNTVLEHMQSKGMAAHLVLGEQEEGNQNWLDNGQLGVQRKLFYRELIARFAHLHALKWNLSEESRYGNERHLAFANVIRNLDWAQHPIAVHSFVDDPNKAYDQLIGNDLFSASSIQFSPENADALTEEWRAKTQASGVPWVIDMDEVGPGSIGLTDSNSDELRRNVLYPVYFSGGNIEWYFGFEAADIRTENFRTREPMYRYTRYAREFMEQRLPFWEMQPDDQALVGGDPGDQVFAKAGEVYAVYLNRGNSEPRLNTEDGDYTVQWYNPLTGIMDESTRTVSGSSIEIGASPNTPQQDWVVLIKRDNGEEPISQQITAPEPSAQTQTPVAPIDPTPNEENIDSTANGADTSATENEPEIAAASKVEVGGASTNYWSLSVGLFFVFAKLLRSFRRWRVLLAGFHMLSVQGIKIDRVEQ